MKTYYFSATWALAKAQILRSFRDKGSLFFTFLFPLIFLFVFGSLNRHDSGVKFTVAVVDRSGSDISRQAVERAEKAGIIEVDRDFTQLEAAKKQMSEGRLDSVLEFPQDFGVAGAAGVPSGKLNVYYDEGSPQAGQAVSAVMQGIFDAINEGVTGASRPFTAVPVSAAVAGLSSFDYIFAGLLGYTILSLGIFGMATTLPSYKKSGLLRRIRVAPVTTAQLVMSTAIRYLVTGLASLISMVVVAIVVFDFSMKGSYLTLLVFAVAGILVIFGFGLAIGGWARNEDQAQPLANLVAFPLMFLSGVFFPRFLMPEWLQSITFYLPLSPIVDGFRKITAEGVGLLGLGHELGLMAVWAVLIYLLAVRLFRWE